jgi:hypothetical protein
LSRIKERHGTRFQRTMEIDTHLEETSLLGSGLSTSF